MMHLVKLKCNKKKLKCNLIIRESVGDKKKKIEDIYQDSTLIMIDPLNKKSSRYFYYKIIFTKVSTKYLCIFNIFKIKTMYITCITNHNF